MIKLPRLYVKGKFNRIVHPVSVSITQNIIPLDTASITLPLGEEVPARSWLELFTPYGSAGMFRVRSPHDAYGQETTTAELEHMISEVGDYVVKEEISEMLPADAAMKRVFSHYKGSNWKLGSVSALGSGKVACEAKYERVLDSMLAILEQKKDCMMAFDFSTTPWTVKIVKKGTSVTAEGRLSRNVSSATITYDDTELCTRVYYQTFDKNKKATWKSKDSSTKSAYGIVEGTVRTSSDMTTEEINATVDAYLNDHKEPRISVNIQADELSQITGESLDKFTIGKLMRLNLVDYGVTVEEVITSITWNDVYNSRSVAINLGAEEDTVVTFLHNLDSKGSGGGGGGRAKDKEDAAWKEYYTDWQKTDEYIAGMATHVDKYGNILEQAGLTLNSKGLLVYAKTKNGLYHQFDILADSFTSQITDTKKGLESTIAQTAEGITLDVNRKVDGLSGRIDVEAGRIGLVVTGKGKDAKVNVGQITLAINEAGESEAHIDADKIYIGNTKSTTVINGKCTLSDVDADHIQAQILELATLTTNAINCSGNVLCRSVDANHLYCEGEWEYNILDAEVNGNTLTLYRVSGEDITFSKATSLSGAWSGNTWTVTASPQGNTKSVTPEVHAVSSQGGAYVDLYVATGKSSGTGYDDHGDAKKLYLVQNGLTVNLKNQNSTSSGTVYAMTTIPNATVSGSWSSNTWTATSTHGGSASVSPYVNPISSQGGVYVDLYVATSKSASPYYDNHGTATKLYLVKNGSNVQLRSANSTSSGTVYAQMNGTGIGIYDTNENTVTSQSITGSIDLWAGYKLNDVWVWGSKVTISNAYTGSASMRQQSGYAGASKMVMYYKDNQGNYVAAASGSSMCWYYSSKNVGNTSAYKTFRYEP